MVDTEAIAVAGGIGTLAGTGGLVGIIKSTLASEAARAAYYAHQTNITADTVAQANEIANQATGELFWNYAALFVAGLAFGYLLLHKKLYIKNK